MERIHREYDENWLLYKSSKSINLTYININILKPKDIESISEILFHANEIPPEYRLFDVKSKKRAINSTSYTNEEERNLINNTKKSSNYPPYSLKEKKEDSYSHNHNHSHNRNIANINQLIYEDDLQIQVNKNFEKESSNKVLSKAAWIPIEDSHKVNYNQNLSNLVAKKDKKLRKNDHDSTLLDTLNHDETQNISNKKVKISNMNHINMFNESRDTQNHENKGIQNHEIPQKENLVKEQFSLIDLPLSKLVCENETRTGLALLISKESKESNDEDSNSLLKFIGTH